MYDLEEENNRPSEEMTDAFRASAPPLRLAGFDESDTWEPNVVRGID